MAGETQITVIGNLTGDPEVTFLNSGPARAKFTVASTPRYLDRESGQWKDGEPLFLNCTAWRELASNVVASLSKGSRVIVVGRLKQSRWETDEGEKRSAYGVEVDEIGPSLRFASAKVVKATRSKGGDGFVPESAPDSPWDSTKVAVGAEGF
ncbi:single-stranded DNA-binding protein [Actinoplanes derwentensis]|uniref:Single-stranded DNA-binding protein n=1 Tax=Actinoplanes derwentensis TaxID=113562 RepID=A0A1H1ZWM5_9ACTN|nr:single-stranded DNA-binding protein [Actinoplanes derwentensis]GID83510.1 single-stranded DNA-binding protein [Actinoplanes derwentensis]SDT37999.1 single-strand binding protein [Actinoplanes derwentensis]